MLLELPDAGDVKVDPRHRAGELRYIRNAWTALDALGDGSGATAVSLLVK